MNKNYFKDNIKLVDNVVNKIYNRLSSYNLSVFIEKEDIYQEGLIGLYKASKLYNVNRNVNFSTYASKSIKRNIERYIGRMLSFNKNNINIKLDTYKACKNILNFIKGRDKYSIKEISESLNIKENRVNKLLNIINQCKAPSISIEECENYLLHDKKDYFNSFNIKTDVNKLINNLNIKEQCLVNTYYGLDNRYYGLEDCQKLFNMKKQQVKKTLRKSINKLKKSVKNDLKDYLYRR